jgi:transposase
MSELFLLSERQMARISPFFPLSHGVPRVDDRRVISGIIYVIKHGLQWKDAPKAYGPHKTLYNRFVRWSLLGVFDRIFVAGHRGEKARADHDRRDAPESPPYGGQFGAKRGFPCCLGRTKGGLNSKLHAVCDEAGKPILLHLTAGQVSDHKGAQALLPRLPRAAALIADSGYDSNWFRNAWRSRARRRASRSAKTVSKRWIIAKRSTVSAIKSRICLPSSRTGGASPHAMTAAPIPSSRPSASQPQSPSI